MSEVDLNNLSVIAKWDTEMRPGRERSKVVAFPSRSQTGEKKGLKMGNLILSHDCLPEVHWEAFIRTTLTPLEQTTDESFG